MVRCLTLYSSFCTYFDSIPIPIDYLYFSLIAGKWLRKAENLFFHANDQKRYTIREFFILTLFYKDFKSLKLTNTPVCIYSMTQSTQNFALNHMIESAENSTTNGTQPYT